MQEPRLGVAAALAACFFLSATFIWLRLDRTPPSWDDGYYLTKSLELYDTLGERGVVGWTEHFLRVMETKPPLIAALPTPIYLAVGRKYRAAYATNLIFLAIMFAVIYGIAARFTGSRAGLIAVIAAGTMPVIYGLSHWYLVECGLIAIVCLTVWLLAGWSESSDAGRAAALGLACGFGLLMKASFPLYVAPALGYIAAIHRKTILRRQPAAAFLAALVVVAGPWYLLNFRGMLSTALRAGSADTAGIYQTGDAFSVSAMAHYFTDIAHIAPLVYLAAIPLLAAAGAAALTRTARLGIGLAALWLSPVLFLAAGHYRDLRYAAPLYPAIALMLALLADAAIRRRKAVALVVISAVLALGAGSMLQDLFGLGKPFQLGGLLLNPPRFSYARSYDQSAWPLRDILDNIDRHAVQVGGERRSVLLGTNTLRFNADNFRLEAAARKLPLDIDTTAHLSRAEDAAKAVNGASYFVYKEGGEKDEANFNGEGAAAVNLVRASGRFAELPFSRNLPDGGVAHLFAAIPLRPHSVTGSFLSAGLDQIPDCSVTFDSQLQLTGIAVSRTPDGLKVKYRWRCLAPVDRDYWCFTHIVDRAGQVLGFLDHRFLDGDIPTSQWKPGDVALEELVSPMAQAVPCELRVGIYHRESGERLPIGESTFPVVQNRTAAMIGCP